MPSELLLDGDDALTLGRVRDRWHEWMLDTRPADRVSAEEGVRLLYRQFDLSPPEVFHWYDSIGSIPDTTLRELYRPEFPNPYTDVIWTPLWLENLSRIFRKWKSAEYVVAEEMRIWRQTTWSSLYGQFDDPPAWTEATWQNALDLALVQSDLDLFGLFLSRPIGPLEYGWIEIWDGIEAIRDIDLTIQNYKYLAANAAMWFPKLHHVVMIDRPSEVHLDDDGWLHGVSSPAIVYRDGKCVYANHGKAVDRGTRPG